MLDCCSLCEKHRGKIKKGLFLFPAEFKQQYQNCYISQIVLKLIALNNNEPIHQDSFVVIDNDLIICELCWQLMQYGFTCQKCKTLNFIQNDNQRRCQFCNTNLCLSCGKQLDLFRNNQQNCYQCQRQEIISYKIAYIVMIIVVGLLLPYLALTYLLTKFFDPIHQYAFCRKSAMRTLLLFVILFPIMFPYALIEIVVAGFKAIIRNLR
ncbi:unnamed protein product [Paramecium octaurelia]|uniref:Uncharacterized protein n=1 Tax=Paramecium octaurelia TaxID=43137 RepID=A0A8S1U3D4_PAROT|nr:unnamed protein product [Paramecium octaurelia]CAD8157923.1 unnamed protein product [Paramecium octaurelia]